MRSRKNVTKPSMNAKRVMKRALDVADAAWTVHMERAVRAGRVPEQMVILTSVLGDVNGFEVELVLTVGDLADSLMPAGMEKKCTSALVHNVGDGNKPDSSIWLG
jgi:hypothetical protein